MGKKEIEKRLDKALKLHAARIQLINSKRTWMEKIIVWRIEEKFNGDVEAAAKHGVYLDEWPETYKSDMVKLFEDQFGPLEGKITSAEVKILDLIYAKAEGKWPRRGGIPYLTQEEEEEFFGVKQN